jgi:hypothetical protein
MKSFLSALLTLGVCASTAFSAPPIICQGEASGHLQGFDSDGSFIYWSMFTKLFKTDFTGRVIAERDVDPHHGDCCVHDGKIYVATQNRTKERRGVFINVYTSADLASAGEFPIEFPFEGGIDGITFAKDFFYVGEGKPKESEQDFNWIHKFTPAFVAVGKIKVPGQTAYGIQTITFAHGFFWLGTYSKERTYQCDPEFKLLAHHAVDISVGAFALPKGPGGEPRLMVARNLKKENGRWSASAAPAVLKNGRLELER